MYYVYSLSIKGRIFYIGCSSNPEKRYKEHYLDPASKCFVLIRYWLKENKVPMVMNIIKAYNNKIDAFNAEREYINKYSIVLPLLNNQQYPFIYTTAFIKVENFKLAGFVTNEIQSIKNQIENYGK